MFCVLATSNVISGWIPTCDSAHSRRLYSAVPLGRPAVSTMTCYSTQSHYPETNPTSPYPILIMPSAWLEINKYNFLSHCFDCTGVRTCEFESPDLPKLETAIPSAPPATIRHLPPAIPNTNTVVQAYWTLRSCWVTRSPNI